MSSLSPTSTLVFSDHIPDTNSEKNSDALALPLALCHQHRPFTNLITLQISTVGIPLLRLPLPPSTLTTQIYTSTNSLAYTSTRPTRCSGSCTLSSPTAGNLITTTYRFGPGRPPVLRILDKTNTDAGDESEAAAAAAEEGQDEIQIHGTWTNHSQHFRTPQHGDAFEWRYVTEAGPETGSKQRLLILIHRSTGRRVAQLVRTAATRTAGSGKCSAGNGGLLVIDRDVSGEGKGMVEEALIVATCLVMLKKEVDRRRCVQAWVLSAAISGGS